MPSKSALPRHHGTFPISLVNLHVTAKNHLLARTANSVRKVCDDLVGLHATSNRTPYLSLYNRIEGFSPLELDREFYTGKGLARIRAMRGTFFLVTQNLLQLVNEATRPSDHRITRSLKRCGISRQEFQSISELIIRNLSNGPKTAPQLSRVPQGPSSKALALVQGRRTVWRTKVNEVLNLLVLQNRIWSSVEPLEWRELNWDGYGSRIFSSIRKVFYQLPATLNTEEVTVHQAKKKLAQLYIKRYGPATVEDVAWWLGEPLASAKKLVQELADELVQIRVLGVSGEFLLHSVEIDLLRAAEANKESVVHLLPYEDPYAKGWKLRERILSHHVVPLVYTMGNALPTVLVNGRIVGTWSVTVNRQGLQLTVGKLAPLSNSLKTRIQEEGHRIGKFLMRDARVTVTVRAGRTSKWQAISLSARPRNRSANTSRLRERTGQS